MQDKTERVLKRSFIVTMFFLFVTLAFFHAQYAQAWRFQPFDVTIANNKCAFIDLNKYVTDVSVGDEPTWHTADIRYLNPQKILADLDLSDQGILRIHAGSDDTRIIIYNVGNDTNPPYIDIEINDNPAILNPSVNSIIRLPRDKEYLESLAANEEVFWAVMNEPPELLLKCLTEGEFNALSDEDIDKLTSIRLRTESFEVNIENNKAIFTSAETIKNCGPTPIYFVARDIQNVPKKSDALYDYRRFTQKIGAIGADYIKVEVNISNDPPQIRQRNETWPSDYPVDMPEFPAEIIVGIDEEIYLNLEAYVHDPNGDNITWAPPIPNPYFDVTIDNIGKFAIIAGKKTGKGGVEFQVTDPCGLHDEALSIVRVKRLPVIEVKKEYIELRLSDLPVVSQDIFLSNPDDFPLEWGVGNDQAHEYEGKCVTVKIDQETVEFSEASSEENEPCSERLTFTILDTREYSGGRYLDEKVITVSISTGPNKPPIAAIAINPAPPVRVGQTVEFDGSSSTDADGTITSYKWDFGDGKSGAGKNDSNVYQEDGKYTVILTVTDDKGATGTAYEEVTIGPCDPPEIIKSSEMTNVVTSANTPYVLRLDDKVKGDNIKWRVENQKHPIEVIISIDNRAATFTVKDKSPDWCGFEASVKLIAFNNCGEDSIDITVRVTGPPLVTLPEWILWQSKSQFLDLEQYADACDTAVSWEFDDGDQIHLPKGKIADYLFFTTEPNWSGLENIHYTVTNNYNQTTEGMVSIIAIPDQLECEEDQEFIINLPRSIYTGKQISWVVEPNDYLDIATLPGKVRVRCSKDWNGITTIHLTAECDGKQATAVIDVTVLPGDPPVINDNAILAELQQAFGKEEVVISVNKPYVLRLDDKVMDPDTPISDITWTLKEQKPYVDIIISDDNVSATFEVRGTDWCGIEYAILLASDNPATEVNTDKITLPIRVIGSPIINLPECILLQPGMSRCLDLNQYAISCDTDVSWDFSDNDYVDIEEKNNLLCFEVKSNQTISSALVECLDYTACNSYNMCTTGTLSVIILPDYLEFKEDSKGALSLPQFICAGKQVSWAHADNADLDIKIVGGKAIITPKTEHWNGQSVISLIADLCGEQAHAIIDVSVIPVCDPPVINETAILEDLRSENSGEETVVISASNPYTLKLDDKVTDVDTERELIKWAPEREYDNVDVVISYNNDSATFQVKNSTWCGVERITLIVSDDCKPEARTGRITLSVRIIAPPVVTLPEWILLQPSKSVCLDLKSAVVACDTKVAWNNFTSGNYVKVNKTNNLLCLQFGGDLPTNVECIHYTVTNANSFSTEGSISVIPLSNKLEFEEDKEGTLNLPQLICTGKQISWTALPNDYVDITMLPGKARVKSNKDWYGTTRILLSAEYNGRYESAAVDVIVTPICDPPAINDNAIFQQLQEDFGKGEVVISADKPYVLRLDNQVTDADDQANITWALKKQPNYVDVVINDDNLSVTFKAKDEGVDWCGIEHATLVASDDCETGTKTDEITIPVRVVGNPVLVFPECIMLQPRMSRSLNLERAIAACDTTVSWDFLDNPNVEVKKTGNLLTFQLKSDQPISSATVECIDYTVWNIDNMFTNGVLSVIVLPDHLDFEEDTEGVFALPQFICSGELISWSAALNNNLDVTVLGDKAVITSKTENWNGITTIYLTGKCDGEQGTAIVNVNVTPVCDPPVINKPAIWDDLRSAFGAEEVAVSGNKRYVLKINDKVTDIDTPIPQITWALDESERRDYVDVIIDNDNLFVTFKAKGVDCGTENVTLIAADDCGIDQITIPVRVICGPSMPLWMLSDEEIYLPSTITDGQIVKDWEFFRGNHTIPVLEPDAGTPEILRFTTIPNDWWGAERIYYTVTYENGLSASGDIFTVSLGDLVTDEDVPKIVPLFSSTEDVSLTWGATSSSNITVTPNPGNRTITFTPEPDWDGGAEKISITITDDVGESKQRDINVTVIPVPDALKIKRDEFPSIASFSTNEYQKISLADKVDNPDKLSITWVPTILAPAGNEHISVDIIQNELAIFRVAPGYQGWSGKELVKLTVESQDVTPKLSDSILIEVEVFGGGPKVDVPIFKVWNGNSDWWDLSGYIGDASHRNSITWNFTPSTNIGSKVSGNYVKFNFFSPNWTGEDYISYTAHDRITGITTKGFITIIGIDSNVPVDTLLAMPKSFKWNNQTYELTWWEDRLDPCVDITKQANNEFTFSLAPGCTTGSVVLGTTGGGDTGTVDIIVNGPPTNTVIIKPFRFPLEKGFAVENGKVSLRMAEDSRVKLYLADKVDSSDISSTAPSLEAPKLIWTAKRSQHIDVQIDNIKQMATFIPDSAWDNITGEAEIVALTATDEKTGNADTKEIMVTVTPTTKPEDGFTDVNNIVETVEQIPVGITKTALLNNFPNPFNAETWIPYKLSTDSDVKINIYDGTGKLICTIDLGNKGAGIYTTKNKAAYWNGTDNSGENVASGVYFYMLQAGRFSETRKMIIIK